MVDAYSPTEEELCFPENPHIEAVEKGDQLARVGSKYFGLSSDTQQEG